ncbi:alanine racemase [candidate division KSB1 bacterium]|nr:alanine racemase [candidate division KSB1 bacterium]
MRTTVAEINLKAIKANFKTIAERVQPAQVMAVVKADAYGHGALPIARTALDCGARCLGVALIEEGIELRGNGIKAPILVFGGFLPSDAAKFVEYDLQATLYSESQFQALAASARQAHTRAGVHVKIDTGMGRVGIAWEKAPAFVARVDGDPNLDLQGVFTHLATSDERDKSFAHLQINRFDRAIEAIQAAKIHIPWIHAANSGAILDLPQAWYNLVRPGVMLYGYYPSPETSQSVALQPAMTFKTRVLYSKSVPAGTPLSYGRKYTTDRTTRIVTLPVGYADGYNRLLSNRGELLIRGKRYPLRGRVCMDLILVEVGANSDVREGDEAILFGTDGDQWVTVESLCEKLQTIPYEITCWISKRVERIYRND